MNSLVPRKATMTRSSVAELKTATSVPPPTVELLLDREAAIDAAHCDEEVEEAYPAMPARLDSGLTGLDSWQCRRATR